MCACVWGAAIYKRILSAAANGASVSVSNTAIEILALMTMA